MTHFGAEIQRGLNSCAATEAWQKQGGTFEIRGCTNASQPQVTPAQAKLHSCSAVDEIVRKLSAMLSKLQHWETVQC